MTNYYDGHRVLGSDEESIAFWSQVFYMLDDAAGSSSCVKSDPELHRHFQAILKRFAILSADIGEDFSNSVVLYLAD